MILFSDIQNFSLMQLHYAISATNRLWTMSDNNPGHVQLFNSAVYMVFQLYIQVTGCFIKKQNLRSAIQRPGKQYALSLSA